MSTLLKNLKDKSSFSSQEGQRRIVWQGPSGEGSQGGVTQGLIGRYLCCKERFRLLVVEGLKPADTFNHRLEYGQLWHTAEEALAAGAPTRSPSWQEALLNYAQQLTQRYPFQQQAVDHWYNVCRIQFPLYVDWWGHHSDVKERRPLLQEQVFDVPYTLPSGRIARLRGKWDSVDLIGTGQEAGIYLQENKTKGEIVEAQLKRQLTFDLQVMTYIIALNEAKKLTTIDGCEFAAKIGGVSSVVGVRYNVIRRPLSGGSGSIRQHKPTKKNPRGETQSQFYARLADVIKEDLPSYFMRWRVEVSPADLLAFRRQCLDPVLENLCDDYEWWSWCAQSKGGNEGSSVWDYAHRAKRFKHHQARHFREPFGVYDLLKEGGSADLDNYLSSGSEIGLQRTDNLFPELGESISA